ncbi:hypothetical protein ACFQO1_12500 [Jejudonia soesokkakensis]|uniref:Lipoprotein n=1 Tax=Jejudonia soesokkakensis TaxID=1323432 RepID=A0ABW2MYL7_9FLAO
MKKILLLLTVICLVSCASESEQEGLNNVADIYDATTSYSKSFNTNNGKKTSSFNVKVSGSKMIDSLQPTVTTANIATLIYGNMNEEERGDYDHIDVELVNAKNDTVGYYYPMNILENIYNKSKNFKAFSEALINNDAAKLDEIRHKADFEKPIGQPLLNVIKNLEKKHGQLMTYKPFGIAEINNSANEQAFQYQGNLIFRNGKVPYLVTIENIPGQDEVIGFRIF